jgi:transposase-like protein
MSGQVIRYSEGFRLQVIGELESGKLKSVESARRRYDIKGSSTIQKWLKKYGKNHLINKVIIVSPGMGKKK